MHDDAALKQRMTKASSSNPSQTSSKHVIWRGYMLWFDYLDQLCAVLLSSIPTFSSLYQV